MNDRMLGIIAMICAPALLVEALLLRGEANAVVTGITSMVFMAGWICPNTVMRRVRAAGLGKWGRAVLLVQLVGLVLAFVWGFFEATRILGRDSTVYNVTDFAWPLSMVWMLLPVGITVSVAKRLPGWRRFVPFACGLCLPFGMAAIAAGIDSAVFGFGLTAVTWLLLGYVAYSGGKQIEPPPNPPFGKRKEEIMEQQAYAVPPEEDRRRSLFGDASRFRRTALGLCLIGGPLVALIRGLFPQWEERDTTAAYLASMAASPVRAQVSAVRLYFGYLLIALGIFGIVHLLRHRSVVLGHVGGVLAVWSWITPRGCWSAISTI
jgi:hypothetical protein